MLLYLLLLTVVSAHSWVEWLSVTDASGVPVGSPGYPRGNVPRLHPDFGDEAMTYLLPQNDLGLRPTDLICAPAQRQSNQTAGSPMLRASPGSSIVLRYQENGHVTLPQTPPGKPTPGKTYIYATTSPSPTDAILSIHRVWSKDGAGGDQRGMLLGTFDFDDGRCYQVNDGPISKHRQEKYGQRPDPLQGSDLWCSNVVHLPSDICGVERLTLYWVWDWPSYPGEDRERQQIYTTCIDVGLEAH